jgi:hypothetical protein
MPRLWRLLRQQFSRAERSRDQHVQRLEIANAMAERAQRLRAIAEITAELMSLHETIKINYEPQADPFEGPLVEVPMQTQVAGEIIVFAGGPQIEEQSTAVFTKTG